MIASRLALPLLAALVLAACGAKETRPEANTGASTSSTSADANPPPAPVVTTAPAKTACTPATKSAAKKPAKGKTAAPDCEQAPAEISAKVVSSAPGSANKDTSNGKACSPCTVKSRDGTFEGEIHGSIPPSSKWSKLQIGMQQNEVERIIGVSHNVRAYVTGKAFIPFYYGSDRHRYEVVYPGQGSVAYTGGSFGGGRGVLMMINYDSKIQ